MNLKISKLTLSLLIAILFVGCAKNSKTEDLIHVGERVIKDMNVLTNQEGIDLESKRYLVFLILRDCSCVEENIEFIRNNIDEIRSSTTFYIKNPQNNELWLGLRTILNESNSDYIIDSNSKSESVGLIFATDKLFKIKRGSVVDGIEFEDNRNLVLSSSF